MKLEGLKFEDLPYLMAENCKMLLEVKQLLLEAKLPALPPSDLMDIHEAGELLRLTKATIYTKVSKKELPYKKFGAKLFFSRSELTALLKVGQVQTRTEIVEEALKKASNAMKGGV